ncbi:unnamed protein product [Triticum turgidum subsp. durum]|uniref:RING-type domain-containing protein n=1 Tax=Triticum turgidum subsp. durum TaxID=4567 RepID=A0A9R0R1N5_TRITD|nr:unnamed protein product [Triticum turgidum subsp. durum]
MESDGEVEVPLKIDGDVEARARAVWGPPVRRVLYAPEGRFLGPPRRIAYAGNTVGLLSVAAVVPPPGDLPAADSQGQGGGKQILVLYRYTHFSAVPDGVEVCGSTKLHYLRFAVPAAASPAGSLRWAWSSLAPLIYPSCQSSELQALWPRMISSDGSNGIPLKATRVKLIADVGILRREDYTQKRMSDVSTALQDMVEEPWPGYHVGMELRLPEPVHVPCACADEAEAADGEDTDCERPAKRGKFVEERCPICFELLKSDVAVWPGCLLPHVFHGECLVLALKESEMCPLCRRRLSAPDEQV